MDDARTHWEVYQTASDKLDGDRRDALRTVTEVFEAATFSPEGVDSERMSAGVDDAERCLAATDGGNYSHSRFETELEGRSASAKE